MIDIEKLTFEYIEDHSIELTKAYLESYPEKSATEYYDTEHYSIYVWELAYQRVLDYLYEEKYLD
jgi:hypothetical protein